MGFRWRSPTPEHLQVPALLRLPFEIRAQILDYLLPYTLPCPSTQQVTWVRGSITPLLVSRQLYHDCLALLYGANTFKFTVAYDGIRFRFSWLLPSGLRPNKTYEVPDAFSAAALRCIRHVLVIVEHVDSYKGMIMYNCGGRGLAQGVQEQIQRLVDMLAMNPAGLGRVTVRLEGATSPAASRKHSLVSAARRTTGGIDQTVLLPFAQLKNVTCPCILGNVDLACKEELEHQMLESKAHIKCLCIPSVF